jgi:hypothetical protein
MFVLQLLLRLRCTNARRCLVIHQTVFCTIGPLRNWVWNTVFEKQFLHVFLTEFRKTLLVFVFQKLFWKKLKMFYFFLYFKLIFFIFSDHFDTLISKIIFFKIKKIYIFIHFQVNLNLKLVSHYFLAN